MADFLKAYCITYLLDHMPDSVIIAKDMLTAIEKSIADDTPSRRHSIYIKSITLIEGGVTIVPLSAGRME